MLKKVIRENAVSVFALKILYNHAKYLGMVFFTITDSGLLKFSYKSCVFSISFWSMCSLGYMSVLSYAYRDVFQTSNYIRGITLVQNSAKAFLTLAFIKFQLNQHNQFIDAANSAIETSIRITVITKELRICGREFYSIVFSGILKTIMLLVVDAPNMKDVFESKDSVFVVQNCLGYMLSHLTSVSLEVVCLVFTTASRMYYSMGTHMASVLERIQILENSSTTLPRKKLMFDEFCVELEECSKIYTELFKISNKFHAMFQLIILLTFNFTIICVISRVHVCFVNYMKLGEIMWFPLAQIMTLLLGLIVLVICVDLMVRRSKIPKNLDWESVCCEFDERWDRCVYQFLAQLRLEDLEIDIFGLFSLNRELCLNLFSMIVGYLTILIQFSMMGYFKEES